MFPKSNFAALAALLLCACAMPLRAEILVTGGWIRETVPGATSAAGYFTITNTGTEERKLLRLTTPACDMLTLHQSSVDSQGVAHMWPLAALELKPGETVRFQPSGKHMMFMDLKRAFHVGEHVQVTFQFNGEAPVNIDFEVRGLLDAGKADTAHAPPH